MFGETAGVAKKPDLPRSEVTLRIQLQSSQVYAIFLESEIRRLRPIDPLPLTATELRARSLQKPIGKSAMVSFPDPGPELQSSGLPCC
ncbi:hypothetical protein [Qipengyuania sp.]|uniref:hypothetical protein n=1 Tax=Qipengyuania sp. TaxID=2004515 RepID=UPI003AF6C360